MIGPMDIYVDLFAGGGGTSCGNSVCPPVAAALIGANCKARVKKEVA